VVTKQIQISDCIGKCVIYKGHLYEVVAISPDGYLILTNGRLSQLEVNILDVTFFPDLKKRIKIKSISSS